MQCPLAHNPRERKIARRYAASILFVLSMPPLIVSGLLSYFCWEIREAQQSQRANSASQPTSAAVA